MQNQKPEGLNKFTKINIDKRILPLFKTPIILKKINEQALQEKNKYNFNISNFTPKGTIANGTNLTSRSRSGVIPLNKILEIFLKGINLYTNNLNKFLLKNNKLDLILHLKKNNILSNSSVLFMPLLKAKESEGDLEYNKLNLRISNFFYNINKFISVFKTKTLLKNINLFCPNRLLKPESKFLFVPVKNSLTTKTINNKEFFKILISPNSKAKEEQEIKNTQIKYLIETGKLLINDLDYMINKKKNIINQAQAQAQAQTFSLGSLGLISGSGSSGVNTINIVQETKAKENNKTLNVKESNNLELLLKPVQKKLIINSIFNSINKSNELKIEQTINSINPSSSLHSCTSSQLVPLQDQHQDPEKINNLNFNSQTDSVLINSNPISMTYNYNHKPVINKYLKEMSNYNLTKKGIFIFYSNIIGFNFNNENNKLIKNIYTLLAASFKSMYCLISKPIFVITPDKIIIQLFYYLFIPNILKLKKFHKYGNKRRKSSLSNRNNLFSISSWNKRRKNIKILYRKFRKINVKVRIKLRKLSNLTLTKVYPEKFKLLTEILSNLFKKPVELDLIRLHYPYNDSNILVNLLGLMINKIKLRIIIRRLFEKAVVKNLNKISNKSSLALKGKQGTTGAAGKIIPSFLSGMNIRVAGRLLTHKVVPRQTVKTIRRGAEARGKINFLDVARFTNKNKRGAFSITISSGQNFI